MEMYKEIETCPKCNRALEHFILREKNTDPNFETKDIEYFELDVFGCRDCNIEVSRAESKKIREALCPYCRRWYDLAEGHCCCGKQE